MRKGGLSPSTKLAHRNGLFARRSLHSRHVEVHQNPYGGAVHSPIFDLSEWDLMVLMGGPKSEFLSIGIFPKVPAVRQEYRVPSSDSSLMRTLIKNLRGGKDRKCQMAVQERCP